MGHSGTVRNFIFHFIQNDMQLKTYRLFLELTIGDRNQKKMKLWIREHWCLVLHMLLSIADQEFGLLTGFSVAQDGLEQP